MMYISLVYWLGHNIGNERVFMFDFPQLPGFSIAPEKLLALQQEYLSKVQAITQTPSTGAGISGTPALNLDKRFSSPGWSAQPWASTAALYSLNREFMMKMVEAVSLSGLGEKHTVAMAQERLKFFTEQALDAMAPSNFLATNPEAQEHIRQTSGQSLKAGLTNLIEDLNKGRMSQSDESRFVVGDNLAVTPGKVVFRNELIELICYTPTTDTVFEKPILMVPPCINKFYILDLQPENSLVQYLVSQGHQVYMCSWKNVQEDQGELTWDDYLESGVMQAIAQTSALSGQKTINALGFCVGGTLLSAGLAALASRGEEPVASLTLLTTLLDFSQPGVLGLFIDEQHCAMRDASLGKGGVMQGKELATTFSFLRPNDLVWNYVVNNYLKGERPAAFDLLYWNADSTNLPGPMFAWYLRHMYLQNELIQPNKLTGAGEPLDLSTIRCPAYIYGSRDDHIVPWQAAYQSTQLLGGETRFVLGASGHIAGVINPAAKNKRNFWRAASKSKKSPMAPPSGSDQWLNAAQEVPGSWWSDWQQWLEGYSGKSVHVKAIKSVKAKSLGSAPGTYVKQRA
jgi:polyhydroxyalkanoate synthase subunit PhaC